MSAAGVEAHGFHVAERFDLGRPGAWTQARATVAFPARAGAVTVELARPRLGPVNVSLTSGVHQTTVEVGKTQQEATLLADAIDGRAELTFTSPTFVPAELDGGNDRRALGVQLLAVEHLPLPSCEP